MEYIRFGNTGLNVSRICLGCMTYGTPTERWPWALKEEPSRPFIQKALELGINFFDTADVYSVGLSEEILGRALKDFARRDEVVIATKVHGPMGPGPNDKGLSRKHIMDSIDASLRRLGTDYVDLYQIHRWDYEVPIEETLEALHDIVKMGKARYIGASRWTRFVSMQPQYNLVYREEEREMLPLCKHQKIAVIPWSPLARGLLTGKRTMGGGETERARTDGFGKSIYTREDDFQISNLVHDMAQEKGIPNAQIALAWVLSKSVVTAPIIGASKTGHLEDAVGALSVKLSAEEIKSLEDLYKPHPVLGHS
jgi:aryl-alcohol dehydrogenase-like predicted oxidoreductase